MHTVDIVYQVVSMRINKLLSLPNIITLQNVVDVY